MKRVVVLILVGILGKLPLHAAFNKAARGTSSGTFLKLSPNARELALGVGGAAVASGPEAVYWNAAALGSDGSRTLSLNHSEYLSSVRYSNLTFVTPLKKDAGLGFGITRLEVGDINQVDDAGADVGEFSPQDVAVAAGAGVPLGRFRIGAVGKYVYSKIIHSASAFTFDVGATFAFRRSTIAATYQNAIGGLKFVDEEAPLPRIFRLGAGYRLHSKVLVSEEMSMVRDVGTAFAFGLEWTPVLAKNLEAALRAGFNSKLAQDKEGLAGATMGAGLGFKKLRLDYALSPFGDLGIAHLFSVTFPFGTPSRGAPQPDPENRADR